MKFLCPNCNPDSAPDLERFEALQLAVEDWYNRVKENPHRDYSNHKQFVFEKAVEAFLGADVWPEINALLRG